MSPSTIMFEKTSSVCAGVAGALNDTCFCISLDQGALRAALRSTLNEPDLFALIEERCPHVFATQPVFMSASHVRKIKQVIQAVESVIALPSYQAAVLADVPDIAHQNPRAKGVFFGYDFHLDGDDVALIEINTNAGGAMLNVALANAQRACCEPVEKMFVGPDAAGFGKKIIDMFREEWRLSGRTKNLQTIAIVDDKPAAQYLYPEFLLFQRLFRSHGIEAVIADPAEMVYRDGVLWHGNTQVDLVYNRLTDFMLNAPSLKALRHAYLEWAVVLTPHPRAHSLYANKRNLALLTDPKRLSDLGVPESTQEILQCGIPKTELVETAQAEHLWAARRKYFFKPAAGYGSRAAYRGDKLTKRVWEEILSGDYVAQAVVAPSERAALLDAEALRFKFDVRAYVYDGTVQWLAARLYQGQTTNFRTRGGGFAPIYTLG